MNKTLRTALLLLMAMPSAALMAQTDYTAYVNPFIGSGGDGHVFVGASLPFGAMQVGPQGLYKQKDWWDWCSGYNYSGNTVAGFTHTHLSGTGCADLGDIALMPYTGEKRTSRGTPDDISGAASAHYSHSDETCQPGYYAVKLSNGVNVELTATTRVGLHHYTFTADGERRVLVDLDNANGSLPTEGYLRRVDDYTIEGYRFARGWSPKHKVFFVAKFNKPITSLDTYCGDTPSGIDELQTQHVKGICSFGTDAKELMVKVAISSVSMTNARLNMETELPSWDFEATRKAAHDQWNNLLGLIDIEATPKQKAIFYTALFHTFIAPATYQDVNGQFRGIDDKVYTEPSFTNYTTFSLWDTYRQLHPMFTILIPDRVSDMVSSMLSIYDQNGKLPIWPLWSGETDCMPGYSSVPVIADAYLKGIRGYDAERALRYMISTSTNPKQNGVDLLMQYGYIPADKLREATSIFLEYAADDMGTALMAKAMGKTDVYETYLKRALSYKDLFDNKIQKIHPKMADGSWYEPYDPFLANHRDGVGDFTEGNGWQYTFMVPQDPDGLVQVHGGDEAFIKNLDELFVAEGDLGEGAPPDVSGMIGQYAHGNEPNHHIPYLYAYAGQQWKTASWIRRIQEQFYTDQPDGYCGNEDCGQMSAWHVMSALGFYQVTPSDGQFVVGSPLFTKATIKLPNGKTFTINAPKNSAKNVYVSSAKLNGKSYSKSYITYSDIMNGGTLTLNMSDKPNKKFGAKQTDRPVAAK